MRHAGSGMDGGRQDDWVPGVSPMARRHLDSTVSTSWKIRLSKPAYRGGSFHHRPTSWSLSFAAHICCPYLAHAAGPCGLSASTIGRRNDARISALQGRHVYLHRNWDRRSGRRWLLRPKGSARFPRRRASYNQIGKIAGQAPILGFWDPGPGRGVVLPGVSRGASLGAS